MPYCTNCGSEVTEKMLFCHECGSKLIIPEAGFKNDKLYVHATDIEINERADIAGREIRKGKLYKQWIKYAGLPVEKTPSIRTPRGMPVRGENKAQHPHASYIWYILLVVGILLCIGLVIFLAKIW